MCKVYTGYCGTGEIEHGLQLKLPLGMREKERERFSTMKILLKMRGRGG